MVEHIDQPEYRNLPVYSILAKYAENKNFDLTSDQKQKIIQFIQNMDENEPRILFTIIKIYSLKNTTSTLLDIPYQGTCVGETKFTFDLDNFPYKLRHMIYKFYELHLNK